jgi:5'-deoxynucleotidase YfbR-like HD superfamily hydrolase
MPRIHPHTSVGPTIGTKSGYYFNLLEPETSIITIEDIVSGLSKCCRFAGQCDDFYSVAQHCVLASYIVPAELAMAALFHDASEAYTGDISKPLKNELGEVFRRIEQRIEAAIFSRFGLTYPMHPSIKVADRILLATEQRDLMVKLRDDEWAAIKGVKPVGAKIYPLEHRAAAELWLARYRELTNEANYELPAMDACA